MPTTASADRASTALKELIMALKHPDAAKPFLNTGNKLNEAIEALSEILSNRGIIEKSNIRPNPSSGALPPRVKKAQRIRIEATRKAFLKEVEHHLQG